MASSIPNIADPAATGAAQVPTLASLRAELDGLDDALHDILIRRAAVVAEVGRHGGKGRVALRPGREAQIIRRLLARHTGALPRRAIARIWRELLAATTAMQGGYVIAVCEAAPGDGFAQIAREHFGALTPLRVHRSPSQAIAEVSRGSATVAVLPLPSEEDTGPAAWWTALLHRDDPRIYVIARLPFWAQRTEGAPQARALVVAAIAPDASGHDRSLIGLELNPEASRARLLAAVGAAGIVHTELLLRRDATAGVARALIEVEGMVADDDLRFTRLTDLVRPPVVLGGYAVPIEGEGI